MQRRNQQGYSFECLSKSTGKWAKTIVDLFSRAAMENPDELAVIYGEESLSYKSLDEKTNNLAQFLIKRGVQLENIVPVFIENGLNTVVAILAIMKAGGAYVPIDPDYPTQRVSYMLDDIRGRVVLSSSSAVNKLPFDENYTVILVDGDWPLEELEPALLPAFPSLANLAYIIYTSGSTGKPKGVMVEHAQIQAYLVDIYDRLGLEECNSYAMLGTFSSDAGLTALFAALCFGKSLHIINIKNVSNFENLISYFAKFSIDCYKITPSLLEFLLNNDNAYEILPKKKLILGGEACSWMLVDRLFRVLPPGCTLYNHYGPTETTVGVLSYKFDREKIYISKIIPLGLPFNHVKTHLLNENLMPVSSGKEGELYIEGPLVARGYLNNPEMTAAKFISYEDHDGSKKLYKTGDLGKTLSDGNLEYLGRTDDQVKIRGHRIELGEIQNIVLQSGMIRECVIMARQNKAGVKYLAGYVIPRDHFDKNNLLGVIKKNLPGYMIPGRWVVLNEWPLTFNNKIDKKALPDPDQDRGTIATTYQRPGELKTKLILIWRQVLGLQEIEGNADFIELGGDSLQLIKLSFEIYNQLNIEISSEELFSNTTIDKMANFLSMKKESFSVEQNNYEGFDETEASATQKNWFIRNKLNPLETFPNSSLTYEIIGTFDVDRLEQAFSKIISMHESLRTSYYFAMGKVYKRIDTNFHFHFNYLKTDSGDIDKEISTVTKPFNFNVSPLLRVFIIELADMRKYLHIDMPHINSDGESLKIIVEDLVTMYTNTYVSRKRFQFSDFQKSVFNYLKSAQYQIDDCFWTGLLSSNTSSLNFGYVNPAEKTSRFDGVCVVSHFSDDLTNQIKRNVRKTSITRFQLLLASYFLLLHKVTAAKDMSVIIPVHNRNERTLAGVVGLLTNTLLIKVSIQEHCSISDFISHCREAILNAVRHQKYPFEKLVRKGAERGIDIKNLFHSFFGYHYNQSEYVIDKALLKLYLPVRNKESLPLSMAIFETEFDLTLRLSSTMGAFNKFELKNLMKLYFNILNVITIADQNNLVGSLLNDQLLATTAT